MVLIMIFKKFIKSLSELINTKKDELPRLECFHNGIILIVNCLKCISANI